jgi:DNA-binding NarL/FixJ family response regulator
MAFLLVDDQPIITYALSELLKDAFPNAAHIDAAGDSLAMLKCLTSKHYDFLILDLIMPGVGQSIAMLRAALSEAPNLGVVIFSGNKSPCLALAALEQGASAYVCKSSGYYLIIEAIQTLKAGKVFCDPVIDLGSAHMHPWYSLSDLEWHVLLSLARGECLQVVAKRQSRDYKTIAAHKYNALNKLGLSAGVELANYLVTQGLGYLLNDLTLDCTDPSGLTRTLQNVSTASRKSFHPSRGQ